MERGAALRIAAFITLSYSIAILLDIAVLFAGLPMRIWSIARMWSVALAAIVSITLFGERVSTHLRSYLHLSRKALVVYLLSPLVVYATLGIYAALAYPLGLFDFGAFVDSLAALLEGALKTSIEAGIVSEEEIRAAAALLACLAIPLAYVAGVTINALVALGEEIGWRGYLYAALGGRPTLRNTALIGLLWGLWHAPATLLLGYNYYVNRIPGVAVFTLIAVASTYLHLVVTSIAESVLPAASLHGTVNALWGLTILASRLPQEQRELLTGLGALGLAAWVLADVVLHAALRKRGLTLLESAGTLGAWLGHVFSRTTFYSGS